jgi:hypothetical protein
MVFCKTSSHSAVQTLSNKLVAIVPQWFVWLLLPGTLGLTLVSGWRAPL